MPSSTDTYTLSLHDALPIFRFRGGATTRSGRGRHERAPSSRTAARLVVHVHRADPRHAPRTPRDGPRPDPGGCRQGQGAVHLLRSEEHTSELQSHSDLVCRLLPTPTLFPYTTLFRSFDFEAALRHAQAAAATSERLHLERLRGLSFMFIAQIHAMRLERQEMDRALTLAAAARVRARSIS